MKARKLNTAGLTEFARFIDHLRSGNPQKTPLHLLEETETSESVDLKLEIGENDFYSRYAMGVYLANLFEGHDLQKHMGDSGFWSWFALLWFDQLCPPGKGSRKPSMSYNYILSGDYKHRPRHAIYMTWQLVSRYGKDSMYLLCKEMSTRGEAMEQMMARQEILSCEGIVRLGSRLYLDPATGAQKRGTGGKGAGSARRYVNWLNQLKLTYDLYCLSPEELEQLLPSEFDRFRALA